MSKQRPLASLTDDEKRFLTVRERDFEQNVRDLVRRAGGIWYHTWRSVRSSPGFPDLTIVVRGRVIFAELKTIRGTLDPAQINWREQLLHADANWYLWRPHQLQPIAEVIFKGETEYLFPVD